MTKPRIERVSDKQVRIQTEKNTWYYLDCPKEMNLIVFLNAFLEGRKKTIPEVEEIIEKEIKTLKKQFDKLNPMEEDYITNSRMLNQRVGELELILQKLKVTKK